MYKSFKISMTFVWLLSMNFFDLSSPGNDYFKILWHPSFLWPCEAWYFYAWPWKLNAATNNSLLGCLKWWFKNRSCLQNQPPPPPNVKSQWQWENMWAFHFQKWTQENHQGQWVFSIQESAYKYSDVTFQTANKASNAILVACFHLIQNVIFKFKPTLHLRCSDISQILVKICQKKKKKKFQTKQLSPNMRDQREHEWNLHGTFSALTCKS